MSLTPRRLSAWLGLCACAWMPAQAQLIIEDKLTGGRSLPNYWEALGGACLTAGTAPESDKSSIPACKDLAYYKSRGSVYVGGTGETLPETDGKGALRLTNGDTTKGSKGDTTNGVNSDSQRGAVVSKETFPSHRGVQVTFTTVTYGGDGYGSVGGGADGMSFYLMDGSVGPSFGAIGGSLGYSCSNHNSVADGVRKGYVGIGIDEYGNFANAYDNTTTGDGFRPGRISVRGAGDISWAGLRAKWPTLYPDPLTVAEQARVEAVQKVCQTGLLYNLYPKPAVVNGVTVAPGASYVPPDGLMNYPLLEPGNLPEGTSLSNQQAVAKPRRKNAKPITYALKITQDGFLSFSYSIDSGNTVSVVKDRQITQGNGTLPTSFRFGFSGSTGSGSNVHEITCFKAAPVDQAESSAATNIPQSARVEAGTQLYLANYHPISWWGELTAQTLLLDPVTDTVSVNPVANWNASCVLTGGACPATGQSQVAQAPQQRRMLTWKDGQGVPFQWGSLSQAQQAALKSADTGAPTQILDYLRGDRSREVANKGPLRTRIGVLGDIIHAGPAWVGAPASPYAGPWADALFPQASVREAGYAQFQSRNVRRQNVVYAGANDGWLHGFRAGGYDAQGRFLADATTPNDGLEVLAFMPAAVLASVHPAKAELDHSSTRYVHAYHVDATPGTGDLYYAGAWHTWLVGGLGAGGQPGGPVTDKTQAAPGALYALDITDPQRFSEANAAALVIGEWSAATLTCGGLANCGQHLGSLYGTPQIRRLHNGSWAVLSGNGLNSTSGTAGLFVMLVDPSTGATSWRFIDTGYGPGRDPLAGNARNGIVQITAADLDGDHITDYVYGGDVFGNVWRFDLTSSDPARWAVSGTAAAPLFSTGGAPITTRIVVASVPDMGGAAPRVMLGFGTGQRRVQTLDSAAQYDQTASHALYGVWDWDLAGWNAKSGPKGRYASLAAPQAVNRGTLLTQNVLKTVAGSGDVSGYRTVSRRKVCWAGTAACPGSGAQFGWVLPLPQEGEQVVYHPVIAYGMLLVNTTIPEESRPLSCDSTPASGFTMALTMGDGGAANASFFANAGNQFVSYDGEFVSGIGLGATGTPSIVSADGRPFMVEQTVKGDPTVKPINPPPGGLGGRLTWMELR